MTLSSGAPIALGVLDTNQLFMENARVFIGGEEESKGRIYYIEGTLKPVAFSTAYEGL